MSFDLKALWREPSTKRGLVMLITGGAVLYQTIFNDGSVDIAGMESRIEHWIGIGMMLAGLLGWLPDSPKEKRHDQTALPPIELLGRSESNTPTVHETDGTFIVTHPSPSFNRYRDPDDRMPVARSHEVQSDGQNEDGWNG